jgi:sugar phosphate isomerase/epimerase
MMKKLKWISLLFLCAVSAQAEEEKPATFAPKFYAFQNGVSFGSDAKNAATLRELGYDGVSQVYKEGNLKEQIAAYDKVGSKVLSIYLNVTDKPIDAKVVELLANRDALIELTVGKITPKLVEAVRQTTEMANKLNIRVALYPHVGNGVETMPQAMDLIAKVDHPNLGVMFNLCHFLKSEKAEDMEKVIKAAGDRLFAVSTNGADAAGKGWNELIQPLDKGDFSQVRLLKALKKAKFKGPVGLQCYAVKGDKRTNLKNSISAWRKALEQLADEPFKGAATEGR